MVLNGREAESLLSLNDMFDIKAEEAEMLSPLVLAFVGDTVYDLFIRTMLVSSSTNGVDKLHKSATSYVNCAAQSDSIKRIEHMLTEKELSVFKRGRNAKSHPPKYADMAQYHNATGLEALVGYLFLTGNTERLYEVMKAILQG